MVSPRRTHVTKWAEHVCVTRGPKVLRVPLTQMYSKKSRNWVVTLCRQKAESNAQSLVPENNWFEFQWLRCEENTRKTFCARIMDFARAEVWTVTNFSNWFMLANQWRWIITHRQMRQRSHSNRPALCFSILSTLLVCHMLKYVLAESTHRHDHTLTPHTQSRGSDNTVSNVHCRVDRTKISFAHFGYLFFYTHLWCPVLECLCCRLFDGLTLVFTEWLTGCVIIVCASRRTPHSGHTRQ